MLKSFLVGIRKVTHTVTVHGDIKSYTQQRSSVLNHSVFLHDLRKWNSFPTVFHRKRSFTNVPMQLGQRSLSRLDELLILNRNQYEACLVLQNKI
jgi:hypothetical protein